MAIIDHEGIANEAKLHEIAELIDNNFFMESIREQINAGLDSNGKDYLKEFNIKVKRIMEKYDPTDYEEITEFRDELHREIIRCIEDKYEVQISYDEDQTAQLVRQLYHFFAVDLKSSITAFLYYYIRENYEMLLSNIDESLINRSSLRPNMPEDQIKPVLLLSNMGVVIDTAIDLNISFDTFVEYASKGGDIRSINELSSANGEGLSVSSEDTVFANLMHEMKHNVYDHNIVVQLTSMLSKSFDLTMTGDEDNE